MRRKVIFAVLTVVAATLFVWTAANRNSAATILALSPPNAAVVSTLHENGKLSEVLTSTQEQTNVAFDLTGSWEQFGECKIDCPSGELPFWEYLGELSRLNNLFFYDYINGLTARPAKGESLAYATQGPALLVLHVDSISEASQHRKYWISLHFHPWELKRPDLVELKLSTADGKSAFAKCELTSEDSGLAVWTLDYDFDSSPQIESVKCNVKAIVRPQLYLVNLPLGTSSTVSNSEMTIKWISTDSPFADQTQETYEIAWQSGVSVEIEQRLSDIFRCDSSGHRPSIEDEAWFRQKSSKVKRLAFVEFKGIFDDAGKKLLPAACFSRDVDISHFIMQFGGDRTLLRQATFQAIVGFERAEILEFKIAVPSAKHDEGRRVEQNSVQLSAEHDLPEQTK